MPNLDIPRLCQCIERDRLVLQRPRQERHDIVKQLVGKHWSENGSRLPVPVNLISLYISIVSRTLIAKNPRVMLSTFDRRQKSNVAAMEMWMNKEIKRQRLANTLQRIVIDSLVSIGIAKVSLMTPADAASGGWQAAAGTPCVESIDLDDFFFDTHARDFSEVGYIGHRYRAILDVVRESTLYSEGRKELQASSNKMYNEAGDEKIDVLGRSSYGQEDFEDYVDLCEVYLPRYKLVLTLPWDMGPGYSRTKEPLRSQSWIGRETGPYEMMRMALVPGNIMPMAPIQNLVDLHEAANRGFRKGIQMVDRIKEVTLVQGGRSEQGERVLKSSDGDMIPVDNPEAIRQIVYSGTAAQAVLGLATVFKDLFDFMGGGLSLMGGMAPSSKTLGQDRMLNENSSRTISDMQERVVQFTSDVLRSMGWYWWNDPQTTREVEHVLPGMPDISIKRQITPEQRRGPMPEMEVDPYSMQHATPQSLLQGMTSIVQNVLIPLMPILQQQGVGFDIAAFLEKAAKYGDQPDLGDLVTIQEPPQEGPAAEPTVGRPAETTRNYVRRSLGADTQGNRQNDLMNGARQALGQNGFANGGPQ